ncbi:MAG: hypothetical protein KKI10_00415 [Alphaproteobacteria bacterium]|nr:hypothetical protein [Alphaproteobacteria bacterium]
MALSANALAIVGNGDMYRWNKEAPVGTPVVVTYAFSSSKPGYDSNPRTGFTAFSATQQVYAKQVLDKWAAVSGIAFVEVPESAGGQIRLAMFNFAADNIDYSGFGYYPSTSYTFDENDVRNYFTTYNNLGGDVFMDLEFAGDSSMAPGQRGFSLMLHEIGHALGFKHPFSGDPSVADSVALGTVTVMSYERSRSTTELGSVDVEAVQHYYGTANYATEWDPATLTLRQTGTNNGEWILGTELGDVIYGQLGGDTIRGGMGNDGLRGGKGHDSIIGGDGNDTLYSGLGFDTMTGGAGNDVFVVRGYDARYPNADLEPTITDFQDGVDRIAIEGVTADQIAGILATQQSLSGRVGVTINVDGPKPATITVLGVSQLDSSDVYAATDFLA